MNRGVKQLQISNYRNGILLIALNT